MICVADPAEAAARDDMFLASYDGSISEVPPFPGIAQGVVLQGSPQAGELFLQAEVVRDGVRARFDDAVGSGWRLVTTVEPQIDPDLVEWFAGIGGVVASVGPGGVVTDVDGAYARWFAAHGVVAALQRPDFALFGTATEPDRVVELLGALRSSLADPA
jgi:hypothetical protein